MVTNDKTTIIKNDLALNIDQLNLAALKAFTGDNLSTTGQLDAGFKPLQNNSSDSKPSEVDNSHDAKNSGLSVSNEVDDKVVSNDLSSQENILKDQIEYGNDSYQSNAGFKHPQDNSSDSKPSEVDNGHDARNFGSSVSNEVEIFYEAASNSRVAEAFELKTKLASLFKFNYTDIAHTPLLNPTDDLYHVQHSTVSTPVFSSFANPDVNFSYGTLPGEGDIISHVNGNVLDNDNHINGSILKVTSPGTYHGTYGDLTLDENGNYTYTSTAYSPFLNFVSLEDFSKKYADVFHYTVVDAGGKTDSSTLTININPFPNVYAFPDQNTYTFTGNNSMPVTGNILTNDYYIDINSKLVAYNPDIHNLISFKAYNNDSLNSYTYDGNYGTLTLFNNGKYIYELSDPATFSGSHKEVFEIVTTVPDKKGYEYSNSSLSELTIDITKDSTSHLNSTAHFVTHNALSSSFNITSDNETGGSQSHSASLSILSNALDGTHHQVIASSA